MPPLNRDSKTQPNPARLTPLKQYLEDWRSGCGSNECSTAGRIVHIRGTVPCSVAFVGEAPGESEDSLGVPFVGPAGKLFDKIVTRALPIDVTRAFMNLVGCIPRNLDDGSKSGEPSADCIMQCKPRLEQLLEVCQPLLVVCVGNLSRDWLKRGYKHSVKVPDGVDIIHVAHPAFILRANIGQRSLLCQQASVTISEAWDLIVARFNGSTETG